MAVTPQVIISMSGPGSWVYDQTAVTLAIAANGTAIAAPLILMQGTLNQVNIQCGDIADNTDAIAKSLSNIEIALGSISIATSNQAVIQANLASSVILKNNFDKQVTIDGLAATGQKPPEMPPIEKQLREGMQQASLLQASAWAQGAVTTLVSEQGAALGTWITSTSAYTGVADWVKERTKQIFGPPKPSTSKAKARAVKGAAGNPAPD